MNVNLTISDPDTGEVLEHVRVLSNDDTITLTRRIMNVIENRFDIDDE